MNRATEEYLQSSVMTAPPERLHLLVVEAAIRYARVGREALAARNYERSFGGLTKARECVAELISSIQTDPNPELADRLRGLFLFCHNGLVKADLTRTVEPIDDAIRILELHRETWKELILKLSLEGGRMTSARPVSADSTTGLPAFVTATTATATPYAGGLDLTT
jgi:flagellar secretion chaperone FliS